MQSAPPKDAAVKRELGLGSAAAAVAGEAIAVGIFLTPAGMAKALGSPFWLFAVWLIVGAMTLSGALCYGNLPRDTQDPAAPTFTFRNASVPESLFFMAGCACSCLTLA